ncbi:hypothetical protein BH09BAC3_BH09BAC3_03730 [soil metagenome]
MKRYLLFGVVLFFIAMDSKAQAPAPDSLIMYRGFGSTSYDYVTKDSVFTVSPKQVMNIMKNDPMALAEFKKAKTSSAIAGVMGFAGVILIAIPVVSGIAGGNPEWGLAIGGAGLIIGSIPLNRSFRHHAQHAIDSYNKKHTAFIPRTEYYLSGLGARVVIKF